MHIVSSTDSIAVPLSADVTTATIQDNQVYQELTSSLPSIPLKKIHYMVADPGYDGQNLYNVSISRISTCMSSSRYKTTSSKERLQLIDFYESVKTVIYSKRDISIELLIEYIKSIFRIYPVPVRGHDKVSAVVLLSVLLYQVLVYYNCKMEKNNPKRAIQYMLGC